MPYQMALFYNAFYVDVVRNRHLGPTRTGAAYNSVVGTAAQGRRRGMLKPLRGPTANAQTTGGFSSANTPVCFGGGGGDKANV